MSFMKFGENMLFFAPILQTEEEFFFFASGVHDVAVGARVMLHVC